MARSPDPYHVRAALEVHGPELRAIVRGRVGILAWTVLAPLWPLVFRAIRAAAPVVVDLAATEIASVLFDRFMEDQRRVREIVEESKISPRREFRDLDHRADLSAGEASGTDLKKS